MTNQATRGKNRVGALKLGSHVGNTIAGTAMKFLHSIPFTIARTDFSGTAGAVGTATLPTLIPAQATFDHMAITGGTGFLGNGSALMSFGDGSDVDRYHASGSINVFGTAQYGYSAGVPSGTRYHTTPGTVKVLLQGTSNIGSVTGGTVTGYMAFWF